MFMLRLPQIGSYFVLGILGVLALLCNRGAASKPCCNHYHVENINVYDKLLPNAMPDCPPEWKLKTSEEHQGNVEYSQLNKTLHPLAFQPLPLGTIKPQGWFRQQLELMADGLPGHMHEFYRLVKNATWGGDKSEYSILNEAWPYYINGLVPLAFSLDDRRLIDEINNQLTYVLLRQFSDGWLGPEHEIRRRNFWGRYPFFLAAAQYIEATGPMQSNEMLKAMHRFVNLMHSMLKDDYQGYVRKGNDDFDEQWGRSRASEMILALQWLYEKYPENNEARIHECMYLIYRKAFDWSWWFRDDIYLKNNIETYPDDVINPLFPFLHVVNAAQGLKSPAVMGRLVHDQALFESSRRGVDLTFEYHGVSSGAIIGDERISGNSPARGTELCGVVETMFSLSTLYQILGDASFADRLENAAFNAMPAMITPDWWAHQYVAQINQPYAYEVPDTHFWNVGYRGLTFGLEPNYPCCTVNFPQGYPKLLSNSWVRTPQDDGLAHVVLLPSEVRIELSNNQVANSVHIRCETNYPFTQLLIYHVQSQAAFKFSFRVPAWVDLENPETGIYLEKSTETSSHADGAQRPLFSSKKDPQPLKPDSHTGLHTVSLPGGPVTFSVYLSPFQSSTSPRKPIIHKRPNGAVSVTHGPLLFAYTLPSTYVSRQPENYPSPNDTPDRAKDYLITPRIETSGPNHNQTESLPWNIAIDPSTARVHEYPNDPNSFPNPIWSEFAPPVSVSVLACEIEWEMTAPVHYDTDADGKRRAVSGGYPLPPPAPSHGKKKAKHKCIGRAFPIELRPYGSAKIRMAEFPVVDLRPGSGNLDEKDSAVDLEM